MTSACGSAWSLELPRIDRKGNQIVSIKTNIEQTLEAAGYQLAGEGGIWRAADFASIHYNDGDGPETLLLDTLRGAGDVSIFSRELAAACKDWPSRYHLSAERANLLRPLEAELGPGRVVLEIGAGCGAITRFLGETGAEVLALEGSVRRATIARERTRDLGNVAVVAERFQDFNIAQKFDMITLIGVLEYASLFSESSDPALDMLQRVKDLLAPGGCLVLAIENKLGLKYMAGVPEDHLGEPMVGIENRYKAKGARTYGRLELDGLLSAAGFGAREFLAPLPDYKMPSTIISSKGLAASTEQFDIGALLSQSVRRDPQLTPTTFNLQRAWHEVAANGLAVELANSFLIIASRQKVASRFPSTLAWHFSTQRIGKFARQTCFVQSGNNVRVQSAALQPSALESEESSSVRLMVEQESEYYRGDLVVDLLRDVMTTPDWTCEQLRDGFKIYLNAVREVILHESADRIGPLRRAEEVLPDRFVDATPSNLMRTSHGQVVYFDREWAVETTTLGWLLTRSILFTYGATPVAPMEAESRSFTLRGLMEWLVEELLDNSVGAAVVAESIDREIEFQRAVTGLDQSEPLDGMLRAVIPRKEATKAASNAGVEPIKDVMEGIATLQHSLNLSSQHMVNMYASLDSLHKAVGETQQKLLPTLDSVGAQVHQLSAGQVALHARLTANDDRAEESLRYWSAEHATMVDALRRSLDDEARLNALSDLRQKVESLASEQVELRRLSETLVERGARRWWEPRR